MGAMDAPTAWHRLCDLIDDDKHLWPGVEAALRTSDNPWEALIGGLDDAGVLAYLDTADTGMELADALAQLPRVFALQPDLDEVIDTDDLGDAIRAADSVLAAAQLRLVELQESDADARALVVVPAEALEELQQLTASVDHPVLLPR